MHTVFIVITEIETHSQMKILHHFFWRKDFSELAEEIEELVFFDGPALRVSMEFFPLRGDLESLMRPKMDQGPFTSNPSILTVASVSECCLIV